MSSLVTQTVARRLTEGDLQSAYRDVYLRVWEAGYESDIVWAIDLANVEPDELYVMRETAWVIVNSGFRYAVARKLWPALLDASGGFDPPLMRMHRPAVRQALLGVLNYPRKVDAILDIAERLVKGELPEILASAQDPPGLTYLPFIGSVTCYHLAKVLGVDCVKPDVHLQRAAVAAGFATPHELCVAVRGDGSNLSRSRLTVIDSVLWRYGEQQKSRAWPGWNEVFRR